MESTLDHFFSKKISFGQSPKYLFFPNELSKNIKIFKNFIDNKIQIFYAIKANNYSLLVEELINNKYGFDIASKEELNFVLNLGADVAKITFSAPTKKEEDIRYASEVGVKFFAFDSEAEANKILKNAKNPILFARIAHHSKDAVFNLSSKFGMNEKYFRFILKTAKINNWPLKGITFHVGSQNVSPSAWKIAIKHVENLLKISANYNISFSYLNIGGGIPACYSNSVLPLEDHIKKIISYCNKLKEKFPNLTLFVEPGRAMCANTMVLVSSIIDYKPYKKPPILVVDTGVFNGIIEPIEHFEYPVYVPYNNVKKKKYFRIVGFSCEGYDIIRQRVLLPKNIQIGDKICFMYAGAYTFVYEKFHMVSYPEIVNINKK